MTTVTIEPENILRMLASISVSGYIKRHPDLLWCMPMGFGGPSCDPTSAGGRAPRARGSEESLLIDFMAENVLKTYCRM
jgi:hypothetical protein